MSNGTLLHLVVMPAGRQEQQARDVVRGLSVTLREGPTWFHSGNGAPDPKALQLGGQQLMLGAMHAPKVLAHSSKDACLGLLARRRGNCVITCGQIAEELCS